MHISKWPMVIAISIIIGMGIFFAFMDGLFAPMIEQTTTSDYQADVYKVYTYIYYRGEILYSVLDNFPISTNKDSVEKICRHQAQFYVNKIKRQNSK